MNSRFKRIQEYYPTIHLFGDWYLVRKYSKKARRFSFWSLKNKKRYPDA